MTFVAVFCLGLLLVQIPAVLILLSRLLKGPFRRPPLLPIKATGDLLGKVSIIVPTLNEVERIAPCLALLSQQSYEVREILVVDSHSTDGTREKVKNRAAIDPRFRLKTDDPLPSNWVGRPWALHNGFLMSSAQSEWILGIDADTQPQPGLVASLVKTATEEGYDLLSLSPQFILKYPGEWWLQPALLMTLLYRFDSAGVKDHSPERVMANGQCFLVRRSVLQALGGYECAAQSFCDDVTLARYAARLGYKVGFLDGAKVLRVRMYEGLQETWKEWGRSLDLKDASSVTQLWGDLYLLIFTQGLPLILSLALGWYWLRGDHFPTLTIALGLNLFLVLIRVGLLFAIAPSYAQDKTKQVSSLFFWLSPVADPLAVLRIILSALQRPTAWRGRVYS
ncbi:glycosyl transferase [Aphanothece hegewaldii CCALA 016]|uniref:Glycosyl transferase n=1 Tax=Aphanothece hegewaldii CCALA 016 TaxID=2107694 RepID=A0A2T1LVC4_9CHRO|nr:glycosyltransferase family 2 protein [Aphanothece hegewaldii]PSF35673.1 glycosyl transferase [Aphanothece hegewaldii CCALA 016]